MIEAFDVPNSPRSQKEPMFTDDKKPNLLRTEPYDQQLLGSEGEDKDSQRERQINDQRPFDLQAEE